MARGKKKRLQKEAFIPKDTDKDIPITSEKWERIHDRALKANIFRKYGLKFSSLDDIYVWVYKRIYVLMSRTTKEEEMKHYYDTYIIKISDGKLLKSYKGEKPFMKIGKSKEYINDKENICTENQIRKICEEKL